MAPSPRRPLRAAALSLLAPGLGQVYAGAIARGLVLILFSTALGAVAVLAAAYGYGGAALASALGFLLVWLYALVDARRTARRADPAYALRDYNRWSVYLALFLLPLPVSLGCAAQIRAQVGAAYRVAAGSMTPTLRSGDVVLADLLAYTREPIRRGDIVVFAHPDQPYRTYIKRVVALAGDTVSFVGGRFALNGEVLGREGQELNDGRRYRIVPGDSAFTGCVLGTGEVYVLGDNRPGSIDSRQLGPLPVLGLRGRVERRLWPDFGSVGAGED